MTKTIQFALAVFGCSVILGAAGCGQAENAYRAKSVSEGLAVVGKMDPDALALVSGGNLPAPDNVNGNGTTRQARKIVYTSKVELNVKDFAAFEPELDRLIRSHDAFAAERCTDRKHKDHRGGTWVIRVPVDRYDTFLTGMTALGFATSRSETADDVTEAYVDLQARIINKRKLEQRVVAMLEDRAGKLSEVMEIERELSRIREEIERMEGRMRVLTDQTSLATVELSVTEESRYEPPTAPTVSDRIAAAWGGSVGGIIALGTAAMIGLTAVLPWLMLLVPVALVGYQIRAKLVCQP